MDMASPQSPTDAEEALRSTKEKDNFQRLTRLLMRGGVKLLREVFDSFYSPADLPLKLGDPATRAQLKGAKLTKPMWECLYPSPDTFGKSTDFDITLTFRLLRTICNLAEPRTGWDNLPNNTDHSLEADLSRIKFYRNSFYHNSTMEITNSEFGNLWKEISEALLRIAGSIGQAKRDEWKKSIDKLLDDPLTVEAPRYISELQLWYKNDMDEIKDAVEQVRDRVQQVNLDLRDQVQQVNVDIGDQLQQVNVDLRDQVQQVNVDLRDQVQQINVDLRDQVQQVNVDLRDQVQQVNVDLRDQVQQVNVDIGDQLQQINVDLRDQLQQINQRLGKLSKSNEQCCIKDHINLITALSNLTPAFSVSLVPPNSMTLLPICLQFPS